MNEVKKMNTQNVEEMFQLAAYAFNSETTEKRKKRLNQLIGHSSNYGYFVEGMLSSQVIATHFKVAFHTTSYNVGGIGYVSSYPEYRGEGGISAIMQQMLKDLAQNKIELAYLAPFSYPFYRKYGFEQIFEQIGYTVQAEKWPIPAKTSGVVKRVTFEIAKEAGKNVYEQVIKNHKAALIRESWWWDYVFGLEEKNKYAIYQKATGEIAGYLIYQSSTQQFTIKEWGYLSSEAMRALVHFVGSHNGSAKEFYLKQAFSGENLSFLLSDPSLKMELNPYMMGRIVDFEHFIQKYPFSKENEKKAVYYFEVEEDRYAPWNTGIWQVIPTKNDQNQVKKISRGSANFEGAVRVKGTIQSFTQLLLGYKSVEQLLFFERLKGNAEELLSLSNVLPKGKSLLHDYF
ncbi:enhanced intracellular survival protein Eis [Vagococcus entomophilus]|uniref:GNAT family N-acetyltransferase n=1 Tax=Vagococcus entomophilus TaxID=1160095 RepID=A0A430AIM3_9ENTE|nr:GNAT family N-acetyltransferase [Vagococcus entomophilus]RSU07935.1 GNAT family N-acetyltransferase [Vagococcus entomophilus]